MYRGDIDRDVHGDIRHLESLMDVSQFSVSVHGDIRHLENLEHHAPDYPSVHGDIRHLENCGIQVGHG